MILSIREGLGETAHECAGCGVVAVPLDFRTAAGVRLQREREVVGSVGIERSRARVRISVRCNVQARNARIAVSVEGEREAAPRVLAETEHLRPHLARGNGRPELERHAVGRQLVRAEVDVTRPLVAASQTCLAIRVSDAGTGSSTTRRDRMSRCSAL